MARTSIISGISNEYIVASNSMRKPSDPEEVIVYVEDYEDIPFWNSILMKTNTEKYKFSIQIPSKEKLHKGKTATLKKVVNQIGTLGKNLIACVDSDLDYLLDDYTDTAQFINNNDNVFQTYLYSIENFRCNKDLLSEYCVSVTQNAEIDCDPSNFIQRYSEITYELHALFLLLQKEESSLYIFSDFCKDISFDSLVKPEEFEQKLAEIKTKINLKHSQLISKVEEESFFSFKQKLTEKGFLPSTSYLFIQGHTLQDSVVLMFLKPIVKKMHSSIISEISSAETADDIIQDCRNQYFNQTGTGNSNNSIQITERLRHKMSTQVEFNSCLFHKRIIQNLQLRYN